MTGGPGRSRDGETVDLETVETPVAVVELARARENAERVVAYAREHGLAWRPHVKTHKSRRMARLQLDAGAAGLTVATPREAEVMATVCDDLLLAYPPVGPARVERILSLPESVRLSVGLDSGAALRPLARAAAARGRSVDVLVEVDVGLRRVGLGDPADVVALAEQVAETRGVAFAGIMFYAGHLRTPGQGMETGLNRLDREVSALVDRLQAAGLPPRVVSGGTTPTLWRSHEIRALTEIRPGTCIYNDRAVLAQKAATPDQLAYSILATVVSTAVPGRAAVDAGSKALAKEERGDTGYGVLLDRPAVRVVALSEEHGMLDLSNTDWRPRVGERVRIVPNHVCVSVNLQDRIVVVDEEGRARAWPLEGRGRRPWAPAGDGSGPAGRGADSRRR